MDAISTLTTVLEQARGERDRALTMLRQAEAAARVARDQADQLESYRSEYRRRWSARLRESSPVALLQHVQTFSGRLDQAIGLQSQTVCHNEQRLRQAREALVAREQRLAAVAKLIQRRQDEMRRGAELREQRQLDEAAARSSSAQRNRTTTN